MSFNLKISTSKTKVMAFSGGNLARTKIIVEKYYNRTSEFFLYIQYLGCEVSYLESRDVEIKIKRFRQFCGTTKRTLLNKPNRNTFLKFHKIMAIPLLIYGSRTRH